MSVFELLKADVVEAMKARDQERLTPLRTLQSDMKNVALNAGRREPTDEDCLAAVVKAIKQREDAAEQFRQGGRLELAEQELAQVALFRRYQPEQLSAQELEAIVKAAIASSGVSSRKDMGKVMGMVMPQVKGRADGKAIQAAVQSLLPA